MATFLMLSRWSDKGIQNIKDSPARIDAFKKQARTLGCEVREVYCAMGRYDTVSLVSAPDDETMARVSLALGSLGNVHTETLRLFSEGDFKKLVGSLG
jgi:uncharacterized protein with GYD domain